MVLTQEQANIQAVLFLYLPSSLPTAPEENCRPLHISAQHGCAMAG